MLGWWQMAGGKGRICNEAAKDKGFDDERPKKVENVKAEIFFFTWRLWYDGNGGILMGNPGSA